MNNLSIPLLFVLTIGVISGCFTYREINDRTIIAETRNKIRPIQTTPIASCHIDN